MTNLEQSAAPAACEWQITDEMIGALLAMPDFDGKDYGFLVEKWTPRIKAMLAVATLILASERKKVIEECAKIAADTPDKILCMWDRPGGPPGNGWAEIRGQSIIAQRIRSIAATEG